ncbi:non-histone chromosomal protein HMG-14 isoform X3 [Notamacropus eugenii]|uniref:non-histone chromosomal protein HMG-14 isoform X3 n=1 Tax=Notamacropus eugenii TaxID=9315 RepID=UPI003B6782C0
MAGSCRRLNGRRWAVLANGLRRRRAWAGGKREMEEGGGGGIPIRFQLVLGLLPLRVLAAQRREEERRGPGALPEKKLPPPRPFPCDPPVLTRVWGEGADPPALPRCPRGRNQPLPRWNRSRKGQLERINLRTKKFTQKEKKEQKENKQKLLTKKRVKMTCLQKMEKLKMKRFQNLIQQERKKPNLNNILYQVF